MKYEYKMMIGLWWEEEMNKWGEQGWELIHVVFTGKYKDNDGYEFIFKREKPNE